MPDVYSIFLKKNKYYTAIQKISIPIIKDGKNCLVVAPTGYGKTEAVMLPLIDLVSKERRQGISVLYITPLRALNRDMIKRLEVLCNDVGVTIGVRHGDTSQKERKAQVEKAPEILITTPETLQSILVNHKLRLFLTSLRAIVVDELHELYSNKRGAQLSVAMERLVEAAGDYQRVGISATVGDKEVLAKVLCGDRKCEIADAGVAKGLKLTIEMPKGASNNLKQATAILGSPLAQYSTLDLFNESFIINASIIESLVPQLNNNITSGWVTFANSSSYATDASLYYVVMTVNNAPHASVLVGAATISPWFMYAMNLQNTNSGSVNGLNYTYAEYTNSTAWAQAVYGWKGNHVVLGLEYSNPGYSVNETGLVNAIANDTPGS